MPTRKTTIILVVFVFYIIGFVSGISLAYDIWRESDFLPSECMSKQKLKSVVKFCELYCDFVAWYESKLLK